jgi:glycosyltransferase involved in cell wall biosynthesis
MKRIVSVIVCTHNPRTDYLQAVMDALQEQTLALNEWELLLIDNASTEPLTKRFNVNWHPNGRVIREEELGLTSARLRGIRESRGQLLVFVDDDNVLADNYIETSYNLADCHAYIGAFGGSVRGQFEVPPPEWLKPYLPGLAVEEIGRDYWSNLIGWSQAVPFGAGLCVRRSVAEDYEIKVTKDPKRRMLGRNGRGMGAGEDTDMAWCAIDLGMGTARFHKLRLTHLIPKSRLTENYITRLNAGFAASGVILESLRNSVSRKQEQAWIELIRFGWRMIRASRIQRTILIASRKASREALDSLLRF